MSKKSSNKNTELNPYSIDRLATISPKWKISILKFWFVGATFFITIFGLPQNFDFLDRMVAMWLILTLAFEYIIIIIIYWMHNDKNNTKKYLPHEVNRKSVFSFFATGVYVFVILALVDLFFDTWVYYGIPTFGNILSETSIDPISYGLVFLLFDYLWLRIRNTIKNIKEVNKS